jgi:hypothetical protein
MLYTFMATKFRPHFNLEARTPQQWLTWSLVVMMALLIGSRLAQQNPDIIAGVGAVLMSGILAVVVGWQQLQLRRLHHQLQLLQQQVHQVKPRLIAKTTPQATASHLDTEQLFQQGQTKH